MAKKLSANAKAAFNRVIDRLKSGDLGPIVKIVSVKLPEDCPAANWSARNRMLALAQCDTLDCRTYLQWQAVGRQVCEKGAAYLWKPCPVYKEDEVTGKKVQSYVWFDTFAVFPVSKTQPIVGHPKEYEPIDLSPANPPHLSDVADYLGIKRIYEEIPGAHGSYNQYEKRVRLATHDEYIWFHELGHHLHAKILGKLVGGQDPHQETVADLFATVLMELYGLQDTSHNCWDYISHYTKEPLKALEVATRDIGKMLELLEKIQEEMNGEQS